MSLFALQLAKLFGARVIIISSSPERCARLKSLGADETIDYRADPEWNVAVRKLTNGMGADVTIDVGGAETIERALASTRMGGRLAPVGLLTGRPSTGALVGYVGADITPIRVGSRQDFEAMNRAIALHRLRPVIDQAFPFEQALDAYQHFEGRAHFGKVVISHG